MSRFKKTIIAEQKNSRMASAWTEFLVLEFNSKAKKWRLFIGRYEALAEVWPYYKEENSFEPKLPKTIGGKKVVAVDDDWIVGGPLECWSGEEISFDKVDDSVASWLKDSGWTDENVLPEVHRNINLRKSVA
jgi:hypothetical protein